MEQKLQKQMKVKQFEFDGVASALPELSLEERAGPAICPTWNNRVYTDSNNVQYTVHCPGFNNGPTIGTTKSTTKKCRSIFLSSHLPERSFLTQIHTVCPLLHQL